MTENRIICACFINPQDKNKRFSRERKIASLRSGMTADSLPRDMAKLRRDMFPWYSGDRHKANAEANEKEENDL
jgi:hypothetical protein